MESLASLLTTNNHHFLQKLPQLTDQVEIMILMKSWLREIISRSAM